VRSFFWLENCVGGGGGLLQEMRLGMGLFSLW